MTLRKAGYLCLLLGLCMTGCSVETLKEDKTPQQEAIGETTEETGEIAEETGETTEMTAGTEKETEITEQEAETQIPEQEKAERILCWGDSLTYGQGGNGITYPSVLEEKSGLEVINYGIQGETAKQIGIRMGVWPMCTGAFEIPAETVPTEVSLWQWGEDPIMMRLGDCGINPCYIGGVEGTLSYAAEDNKYYFTRTEAGDAVTVADQTIVQTFAAEDKDTSDIIVLFAGTNLPPNKNTVGELIDMERQMLDYLGAERYVVIGLTSKKLIEDVETINESLAEAFGEHFLDIRSYLLENGLQDAGIEPTKRDKKNIAKGEIPSSLRVDEVHGTEDFYRIIGERVYQKLTELGYLPTE